MTMFVDHDDRLVALNDEATKAVVWSDERKAWVETKGDFPRKAWLDGEKLSRKRATEEFPDADMDALPDFK